MQLGPNCLALNPCTKTQICYDACNSGGYICGRYYLTLFHRVSSSFEKGFNPHMNEILNALAKKVRKIRYETFSILECNNIFFDIINIICYLNIYPKK